MVYTDAIVRKLALVLALRSPIKCVHSVNRCWRWRLTILTSQETRHLDSGLVNYIFLDRATGQRVQRYRQRYCISCRREQPKF